MALFGRSYTNINDRVAERVGIDLAPIFSVNLPFTLYANFGVFQFSSKEIYHVKIWTNGDTII